MLKQIVEAQSPDSMADAVALAMVEASVFLSEQHDIRIAILELSAVRKGGYKAVLEVTIIPLGRAETPEKTSDDIEPALRAEQAALQKKSKETADWKTRILEQFRRRRSNLVETAVMNRPALTEAQLLSQIDGEYSQKVPLSSMVIPDPTLITPLHERVDDKIHRTPIDEIVEREFSHVTRPEPREIVMTRRAITRLTPGALNTPHEEPE